jgi:hypothetical protein
MGVGQRPAAHQSKEAREPQVCHYDHHAQQQRHGIEIDGAIGLLRGERTDRQHQGDPAERDPGPVESQARDAAEGHAGIG